MLSVVIHASRNVMAKTRLSPTEGRYEVGQTDRPAGRRTLALTLIARSDRAINTDPIEAQHTPNHRVND